jgi:PIN domain nuclease of toxin-antitoxin system
VTPPLLDTHVWIWWMDGDDRLPARMRDALDEIARSAEGDVRALPVISDVSLWEVALLVKGGRYEPAFEFDEWLDISTQAVNVQAVTADVAVELTQLPDSLHRDPADRLIIATSRSLELPLLTFDDRIRRSRLVTAWKAS